MNAAAPRSARSRTAWISAGVAAVRLATTGRGRWPRRTPSNSLRQMTSPDCRNSAAGGPALLSRPQRLARGRARVARALRAAGAGRTRRAWRARAWRARLRFAAVVLAPLGRLRGCPGARRTRSRTWRRGRRGRRVAGATPTPNSRKLAIQDVLAVTGRVHPGLHDRARCGQRAGAPGEVLAEHVAGAGRDVAAAPDAVERARAVAAGVGEVGAGDEILRIGGRRRRELRVRRQRSEAVVGARAVDEAERRGGDRGNRRRARRQVGVRAAAPAPTPSRRGCLP